MVLWDSSATLKQVWAMADIALGLMTLVNITAIILLTPTIIALTKDYQTKLATNRSLAFHQEDIKYQGKNEKGIW